jgi:hypothetical protein
LDAVIDGWPVTVFEVMRSDLCSSTIRLGFCCWLDLRMSQRQIPCGNDNKKANASFCFAYHVQGNFERVDVEITAVLANLRAMP